MVLADAPLCGLIALELRVFAATKYLRSVAIVDEQLVAGIWAVHIGDHGRYVAIGQVGRLQGFNLLFAGHGYFVLCVVHVPNIHTNIHPPNFSAIIFLIPAISPGR